MTAAKLKRGTKGAKTRERILRAAERLFAERGFDGVSVRSIASAAHVQLALLSYYFRSKLGLYRAVFHRRIEPISERRLELLRRVLRRVDPPPSIEEVLDALARPWVELRDQPGGQHYSRLIAREAGDPRESSRGIVKEMLDPIAVEFLAAMERALAGALALRNSLGILFFHRRFAPDPSKPRAHAASVWRSLRCRGQSGFARRDRRIFSKSVPGTAENAQQTTTYEEKRLMKLVTFVLAGGAPRSGALIENDRKIVDLQAAHVERYKQPSPALTSVLAIAEGGADALDRARETVKGAASGSIVARNDVKLLAPIPAPPQMRDFLCFEKHLQQAFKAARQGTSATAFLTPQPQ